MNVTSLDSTALLFVIASLTACSASSKPTSAGPADGGARVPATLDGGRDAGSAKKGGSGASVPTASSKNAGGSSTSSTLKTPVPADGGENPCSGVPDGRAACGGDTVLYFCAGEALYALDCNAFAAQNQFTSGACYQTDAVTDCFGCGSTEAGNVCCAQTSDTTALCCDDSSACAVVTK